MEVVNGSNLKKQYLGYGDGGQTSVSKDSPVGMGDVNNTYASGVGNSVGGTGTDWDNFFGGFKNSKEYSDLDQTYRKYSDNLDLDYFTSKENHNNMKKGDIDSLTRARDYQQGLLNDTNAQAQREAYIRKMQNEKSLPLLMASQGFNGGMSESAAGDLQRAYENARIKNDGELSRQTASLGQTYNTNVADANKYYANILAQLESAYLKDKRTAYMDFEQKTYDRGRTAYQDDVENKRYTAEQKRLADEAAESLRRWTEEQNMTKEQQAELNRQWQAQFDFDVSQAALANAPAPVSYGGGGGGYYAPASSAGGGSGSGGVSKNTVVNNSQSNNYKNSVEAMYNAQAKNAQANKSKPVTNSQWMIYK